MKKSLKTSKTKRGLVAEPYKPKYKSGAVDELADRYGRSSEAILPILRGLDEQGLPLQPDLLGCVAIATGAPESQIGGVASFYAMFGLAEQHEKRIRVCDGPVCMLHGAEEVFTSIQNSVTNTSEWRVEFASCLGLCDRAPAALVDGAVCGPICPDKSSEIFHECQREDPCSSYAEPGSGEVRVAIERVGHINPTSLDEALANGAYEALAKSLQNSPESVLVEVESSGLQGRGGAGFPVGRKWRAVAETNAQKKFIVCNADESEPGAFKDRVIMEGDPHLVLEGMALAGLATGANEGIVYVRGEYEKSASLLEQAIQQAEEAGWLGNRIRDSSFSFHVHVHRGAGAYICGEETALLESLEGRRGEPRVRPPFPTTNGYHGQPTVVNNVESLAVIPAILLNGGPWFRELGAEGSPGVKMFTITGHVRRPTVFEVPIGITLREAIDQFGLGMRPGSHFKMALTGGAAGLLAPASLLDVPITYQSHNRGLSIGSGVLMIFDTTVSAVTLLQWLLRFFARESCGKCTPCREGVYRAHQVLRRILAGQGKQGDLTWLSRTAKMLHATSLCGLGKSVAWPIESALEHFAKDFEQLGAR